MAQRPDPGEAPGVRVSGAGRGDRIYFINVL
jgi:hypothetical protein